MAKPVPTFPDFLIIGAPQSGCNTLKAALQKSTNAWFPPVDNLLVFHPSFNVSRALMLKKLFKKELPFRLGDLRWMLRFFLRIAPSPKWYMKLFQTKEEDLFKGELSDEYITLPYDAVERLRVAMPDVKIILMIRNPINRSFASVRHHYAKHPKLPFAKMTKRQIVGAMNSPSAISHSGYRTALDNWGVFFPPKQLFIGFYEDYVADLHSFYTKLFAFLDLPPETPIPDIAPKAEPVFPPALYKALKPFYREEIEGLVERAGRTARTWELPPVPDGVVTGPISKRSPYRIRTPKPAQASDANPDQAPK